MDPGGCREDGTSALGRAWCMLPTLLESARIHLVNECTRRGQRIQWAQTSSEDQQEKRNKSEQEMTLQPTGERIKNRKR